MKKHKIRNVDLNVCCAEQKIAYNLAWRFSKTFYQDYFKAYKKITENPLFGVAPNIIISDLVFKARDDFMKEWKFHCENNPKSNKYDVDLISHCLLNGLENYWKGNIILSSYEAIGKTFVCLY